MLEKSHLTYVCFLKSLYFKFVIYLAFFNYYYFHHYHRHYQYTCDVCSNQKVRQLSSIYIASKEGTNTPPADVDKQS